METERVTRQQNQDSGSAAFAEETRLVDWNAGIAVSTIERATSRSSPAQ